LVHSLRLSSTVDRDGWLLGPAGELGFWLPPEYQQIFRLTSGPCLVILSSSRVILHTATSGLFQGPNWTECWNELH
jgi:hypothetical protein